MAWGVELCVHFRRFEFKCPSDDAMISECPLRGHKRKLEETEDFDHNYHTLFNISMYKLSRFRQGGGLLRSVLICNTLRTIEKEKYFLDLEAFSPRTVYDRVDALPPEEPSLHLLMPPPAAPSSNSSGSSSDEIFGDVDLSLYDFDLLSPLSPPSFKLSNDSADDDLLAENHAPFCRPNADDRVAPVAS